jgi:hypothetical protein
MTLRQRHFKWKADVTLYSQALNKDFGGHRRREFVLLSLFPSCCLSSFPNFIDSALINNG